MTVKGDEPIGVGSGQAHLEQAVQRLDHVRIAGADVMLGQRGDQQPIRAVHVAVAVEFDKGGADGDFQRATGSRMLPAGVDQHGASTGQLPGDPRAQVAGPGQTNRAIGRCLAQCGGTLEEIDRTSSVAGSLRVGGSSIQHGGELRVRRGRRLRQMPRPAIGLLQQRLGEQLVRPPAVGRR